jgi:serine/threonine protein kinase
MTLPPGTRFGAYEIVAPIGKGGMGVVYRAHDVRLNRDVALKLLPETSGSDPAAVARFRFEAQAASALNHPHILTIYDIGETDEEPPRRYIAMEYIAGDTLRAYIGRQRDVGETRAADPDRRRAAKAHDADIVHRDLKPDNIMVTGDGYVRRLAWSGPRRVWISDARGRNAQQVTTDDSEATAHVRPRTASSSPSSARTRSCGDCPSIPAPEKRPVRPSRS